MRGIDNMAYAWMFNSNTGQQEFGQPNSDDTTQQDRQRRNNNRVSGNAGTGSMFTATPGGVQRAYAPSTYSQDNSPTVGSGRQAAMNYNESNNYGALQTISTGNQTIDDRVRAMSNKLANTSTEIPTYVPKLSEADFDKYATGDFNADELNKTLFDKAKVAATDFSNTALGTSVADLGAEQENLAAQQAAYNALRVPSQSTEGIEYMTPKEKQGLQMAIARMRDTGLAGVANTANAGLGNLSTDVSDANTKLTGLQDTLSKLTADNGYGGDEIKAYDTSLQDIMPDYNTLRNAGDEMFHQGITGEEAVKGRQSIYDVINKQEGGLDALKAAFAQNWQQQKDFGDSGLNASNINDVVNRIFGNTDTGGASALFWGNDRNKLKAAMIASGNQQLASNNILAGGSGDYGSLSAMDAALASLANQYRGKIRSNYIA